MTEEQKFRFDLKGWLLLPAALSEAECAAVRDHLKNGGNSFTGPAQELLDHPVVVDILSEILGAVRAHLWSAMNYTHSASQPELCLISRAIWHRLQQIACYAA